MPFQKKSDYKFPLDGISSFIIARGLEEFTRSLEKDFFAKASIQCVYLAEQHRADLVIELQCNFALAESLHYFNSENWGGVMHASDESESTPFAEAYNTLTTLNKGAVDIAEITLHFNDTSLVITRIYDHSISEQLGEVLLKVSEHFVYFTKGLTEMPYEIFVPVFEDVPSQLAESKKVKPTYFDYWGLYFDDGTNHDAMVYNLETKKLLNEDLFLLD
ncbi:MAG: hypothetical protein AB3N18_05545 [Allomuricauda sp.]